MSPTPPHLLPARLPRYSRSPSPPPLSITPRDIAILSHLSRMRYLTREQIQRLEFDDKATSNAKRRMTVLFHNGLVGRRLLPNTTPHGSPRALYYLDKAGRRLLDQTATAAPMTRERASVQQEPYFLTHLLETNDAWVSALLSAKTHGVALTWLDELSLRRQLTGVQLRSSGRTRQLAPIPDGYAHVTTPTHDLSFALEMDRSTTEGLRSSRKFAAYAAFHDAAHLDLFRPGLRVLYVVSARSSAAIGERLQRLVAWCEREGGGSLFWFASLEDVRTQDFFTAPFWTLAGTRTAAALIAVPPRLRSAPTRHQAPRLI